MRDPAYDGEVPVENEQQYEAAVKRMMPRCTHIPEKVRYYRDPNTYWRCAVCKEPLYAIGVDHA